MEFKKIIEEYLSRLGKGNRDELLEIFEEDAVVDSPLYGILPAKEFYADLLSDTNDSQLTLLNTFAGNENKDTCAGHFTFDWTLRDGSLVKFECVDVFKISENNKIQKVTIIYDTFGVRDRFDQLSDD